MSGTFDKNGVEKIKQKRQEWENGTLQKQLDRFNITESENEFYTPADVADVRHRSDQRKILRHPGHPGVQLADPHPRHARGDRLVWTANRVRCVGLEVPRVEVTRPAAQQHEDARLVRRALPESALDVEAGGDESRRAERQCSRGPRLQGRTSRHAGSSLSPAAQ